MAHDGEIKVRIQAALRGRYAIEREIGVGGMGLVFLATDQKLERPVAIKVLRPEQTGSVNRSRFQGEITTVARSSHPGIIPLHDSGEADGLYYYVMAYVEDGTLRDVLKREGKLPIQRALSIATEVCEAVSFAHARGIVHRDLKPGNILFKGNRPIVSDFGIALAMREGDVPQTSPGVALGTMAYMSPEQATGDSPVDGRADIYALGSLLYEMLTGELPFPGNDPQVVMARKLAGSPPPVRLVRPKVPRALDTAISRALEPIPADRYSTMDEFQRALSAHEAKGRTRLLAFSVVGLALLLTAVSLLGTRPVPVDPRMVVVEEFQNRSGNESLAGIGIQAVDWITQGLQATRLASVTPTPSALDAARFVRRQGEGDTGGDPMALLAQETGAGIIVSGAYYLEGDRLTFHSQISDASVDPWWHVFRRGINVNLRTALNPVTVPADSGQAGIAEIRARVMGALAASGDRADFTAPDLLRTPPTYEAYQRFSAGMDAYVSNDHPRASAAFQDAYRRDTTFVSSLLYAALSASNLQRYATEDSLLRTVAASADRLTPYDRLWLDFRQALLSEDRPRALGAIRALSAEAPRTKATYNLAIEAWENGHLEEAEEALRRLPQGIGPIRGFLPYWGALANVLQLRGNFEEALSTAREALKLFPNNWWPVGWELSSLAGLGRVDEVLSRSEEMADAPLDDTGGSPAGALREAAEELWAQGYREAAEEVWSAALRWYQAVGLGGLSSRDRYGFAHTLYALGKYQEAAKVVARLREEAPSDPQILGIEGSLLARQGDTIGARSVINALLGINLPYQFGRPPFHAGMVAAVLGDEALALRCLGEALDRGRSYGQWIRREIDLEDLRETPAFHALTRPVPMRESR